MQDSVLEGQSGYYGPNKGPPILPHGDDVDALRCRRVAKAKRKLLKNDIQRVPIEKEVISESSIVTEKLKQLFPGSDLPSGFPPELAFRALSAYSTIRTLSIALRLSPFTPNVFLRALYLPVPNRLIGQVHVALLRILLSSLHMGYHWKGQNVKHPLLKVYKKRKQDGLRWPLRAGDDLAFLDDFTWPLFCDDYAHLVADLHYASWYDSDNFVDLKNLDISMVKSDLIKGEQIHYNNTLLNRLGNTFRFNRGHHATASRPSVIYLNDDQSNNDDDHQDMNDVKPSVDDQMLSSDTEFEDAIEETLQNKIQHSNKKNASASRGRGRPRKRPPPSNTPEMSHKPYKLAKLDATTHKPSTNKLVNDTNKPVDNTATNATNNNLTTTAAPALNKRRFSLQQEQIDDSAVYVSPGRKITQPSPFLPFSNGPAQQTMETFHTSLQRQPPYCLPLYKEYPFHTPAQQTTETLPCRPVTNGSNATVTDDAQAKQPNVHCQTLHQSSNATAFPKNGHGGQCGFSKPIKVERTKDYNTSTASSAEPVQTGSEGIVFRDPPKPEPVGLSTLEDTTTEQAAIIGSEEQKESQNILSSSCGPSQPQMTPQNEILLENTSLGKSEIDATPRLTIMSLSNSKPDRVDSTGEQVPESLASKGNASNDKAAESRHFPNTTDLADLIRNAGSTSKDNAAESRHPPDSTNVADLIQITGNKEAESMSPPDSANLAGRTQNTSTASKDKELPDATNLADLIQNFILAKNNSGATKSHVKFAQTTENDAEAEDIEDGGDIKIKMAKDSGLAPLTDAEKNELWPHFSALEIMRAGTPYHRLPLDRKLDLLEFLIDDLLTIDVFVYEMNLRQDLNGYLDQPYGELPFLDELKELENDDYCCVCRKVGDLLCCDGCVSSIHRACIDMKRYAPLPEGSWYCPECTIVDSAKYGPLRGGRKNRLDWFNIPPEEKTSPQSCAAEGEEIATKGPTIENRCSDDSEYLAVHGFVFRRESSGLAHQAPRLLDKLEMSKFFERIGATASSSWPLAQVPCERSLLWNQLKGHGAKSYFSSPESYDPNTYRNLYRRAPLEGALRRVQDAFQSSFEHQCYSASFQAISGKLSGCMDKDDEIALVLRKNVSIDFGLQMIRGYMTVLERNVCKSCLVADLWGMPSGGKTWISKVNECNSVRGLARLLVRLVDAMHPRLFDPGWFRCHSTKEQEGDADAADVLLSWRPDLNLGTLVQKRNWERCLPGQVQLLVAKTGKRLVDWISELRPHMAVRQRSNKRKGQERKDLSSKLTHNERRKLVSGLLVDQNTPSRLQGKVKGSLSENNDVPVVLSSESQEQKPSLVEPVAFSEAQTKVPNKEQDQEGGESSKDMPRVLRRSARASLDGAPSSTHTVDASELQKLVQDEMRRVLESVAQTLHDHFLPEQFWSLAGRGLFDPIGRLPTDVIRRLARRGGNAHLPFVVYTSNFEVGQVSYFHIWRKRVLLCESLEELLLLIRILATFIDSATLNRGMSVASSAKLAQGHAVATSSLSPIVCCHRDIRDGEEHFLVIDKESRAKWISFREVDLEALVKHRSQMRLKFIEEHRKSSASSSNSLPKTVATLFAPSCLESKATPLNAQQSTQPKSVGNELPSTTGPQILRKGEITEAQKENSLSKANYDLEMDAMEQYNNILYEHQGCHQQLIEKGETETEVFDALRRSSFRRLERLLTILGSSIEKARIWNTVLVAEESMEVFCDKGASNESKNNIEATSRTELVPANSAVRGEYSGNIDTPATMPPQAPQPGNGVVQLMSKNAGSTKKAPSKAPSNPVNATGRGECAGIKNFPMEETKVQQRGSRKRIRNSDLSQTPEELKLSSQKIRQPSPETTQTIQVSSASSQTSDLPSIFQQPSSTYNDVSSAGTESTTGLHRRSVTASTRQGFSASSQTPDLPTVTQESYVSQNAFTSSGDPQFPYYPPPAVALSQQGSSVLLQSSDFSAFFQQPYASHFLTYSGATQMPRYYPPPLSAPTQHGSSALSQQSHFPIPLQHSYHSQRILGASDSSYSSSMNHVLASLQSGFPASSAAHQAPSRASNFREPTFQDMQYLQSLPAYSQRLSMESNNFSPHSPIPLVAVAADEGTNSHSTIRNEPVNQLAFERAGIYRPSLGGGNGLFSSENEGSLDPAAPIDLSVLQLLLQKQESISTEVMQNGENHGQQGYFGQMDWSADRKTSSGYGEESRTTRHSVSNGVRASSASQYGQRQHHTVYNSSGYQYPHVSSDVGANAAQMIVPSPDTHGHSMNGDATQLAALGQAAAWRLGDDAKSTSYVGGRVNPQQRQQEREPVYQQQETNGWVDYSKR